MAIAKLGNQLPNAMADSPAFPLGCVAIRNESQYIRTLSNNCHIMYNQLF